MAKLSSDYVTAKYVAANYIIIKKLQLYLVYYY